MSRLHSATRLLLLSSCTLMFALAAPPTAAALLGHHSPKKEARQEIAELEDQWKVATLNNDIPAMDRLLSDDYVGISWNGMVNTKTTQLERIRSKTLAITQMDLTDVKIKVFGPVAVVTSLAQLTGTNDGQPMQGSYRYTRVYQRLPSGVWKITNFEATRIPNPNRPHPNRRIPTPSTP